ncbi:aldo/keto reductase [Sporolactobacillus sp. Y61]|uniref:Aldo/keto reductase n=1 Tax=Sporolactobacillus sp. Y61 TaxID=3160863 RepID=A0AAU8IJ27_9BACL|nr:aldo/keto reductase [Sporolactobacillus sp. THM19-2]RYL88529.1 aldo/keto reductase [Sporolactobacillus sp. THM19-2]
MKGINDQEAEKIRTQLAARSVTLPDGTKVPAVGQGTWHMGDDPSKRKQEIEALRTGVDLGMVLIDTAELYGYGKSENLVGEAIRGIRDRVFLVSKAMPSHGSRKDLAAACERSLKQLGTDHLDLYLLHWKSSVPIEETIEGMEALKKSGKILRWGVSNFDTADMENLVSQPEGAHCTTNQVLYHLGSRGIEVDLLPWQRRHHMPIMAYCPLAEAGSLKRQLTSDTQVRRIAEAHHISPLQLLLAWCIRHTESDGIIAIPKASQAAHVIENARAAGVVLTEEEQHALDRAFPRPSSKVPLAIV